MRIAIPSRGRAQSQQTLAGIPPDWLARTTVYVPPSEYVAYRPIVQRTNVVGLDLVAQPDDDMRIAEKRAWIMRTEAERTERLLMLDDDLFFYVRRDDVPDRLRDARHEDVDRWFQQLARKLSPEVPHGGFGPRQYNHAKAPGWHVDRMMLALGYYLPTVLANAELERVQTREDMDVCLQLLSAGLPCAVTHEFAVGQRTYGAPGGCTGERTTESSDADAHRLAELHPGIVRVVSRERKSNQRLEVQCSWRRALELGTARARAQRGEDRPGGPEAGQ